MVKLTADQAGHRCGSSTVLLPQVFFSKKHYYLGGTCTVHTARLLGLPGLPVVSMAGQDLSRLVCHVAAGLAMGPCAVQQQAAAACAACGQAFWLLLTTAVLQHRANLQFLSHKTESGYWLFCYQLSDTHCCFGLLVLFAAAGQQWCCQHLQDI